MTSVAITWDSRLCAMLGANDDADDDSEDSENKSKTEPKWLGSKSEGESEWGTRGDGVNEGDAGADEDEPWDVSETAGPDVTGSVDDGEELGDWKLSHGSGEESSYFLKLKKWNPGFWGSSIASLPTCSIVRATLEGLLSLLTEGPASPTCLVTIDRMA